ncbi:heterokaryon incompatibility protein-domain-containing protein, partial [Leptodontidium sp. MPI-SDFR-AT-0119]
MSQYRYSPLSPGRDSIRLLRLLPHEDETADIQCELFEYSLPNSCKRTHLYDSLSYVWGNPEEKLPIFIHKLKFDVTVNLRAALSRLRNHSVERILWIDAICIDQANQEEKEHQIQSMAKIYGQANRVVVWLGEAADDSDLAFEEIRIARGKKSANSLDSEKIQQAVLALLQRPWFRRIWILQEVAAARNVLIMCGFKKIDGYVFCLGVDSLKDFYEARPDLQGLIRSVTYLIREAIFRPGYSMGSSGRSSLDICPLGELMDMYHAHEATKRHDKVYALLGMSSDDLSEANLLPNYRDPWEELLQRLAKFLLSEKISVETWGDKEIAAIKSKGCILGKVSSVLRDTALDDRQSVDVIFKNISGQPEYMGVQRWTLRPSAKSIRDGDLICLLQGASKPAVIRLCKDHFAIIMIAATPLENIRMEEGYIEWPNLLQSAKTFTRDFLLFWDWENFPKKFQDPEEYEMLIRTNDWVSEHSKAHREGHLDKATRVWNVALILGDLEEYKEAEER